MIDMAETFDMTTIAEGVETAAQSRLLAGLGCKVHQGHYYSRPLCPEDASDFIRQALRASKALPFLPVLGAKS